LFLSSAGDPRFGDPLLRVGDGVYPHNLLFSLLMFSFCPSTICTFSFSVRPFPHGGSAFLLQAMEFCLPLLFGWYVPLLGFAFPLNPLSCSSFMYGQQGVFPNLSSQVCPIRFRPFSEAATSRSSCGAHHCRPFRHPYTTGSRSESPSVPLVPACSPVHWPPFAIFRITFPPTPRPALFS